MLGSTPFQPGDFPAFPSTHAPCSDGWKRKSAGSSSCRASWVSRELDAAPRACLSGGRRQNRLETGQREGRAQQAAAVVAAEAGAGNADGPRWAGSAGAEAEWGACRGHGG